MQINNRISTSIRCEKIKKEEEEEEEEKETKKNMIKTDGSVRKMRCAKSCDFLKKANGQRIRPEICRDLSVAGSSLSLVWRGPEARGHQPV
ncbi:hypothetical protein PoB_007353400 [Plakobranchus ocellatus]|uniref:Uncharacterized protein n=1 Tax=Plakobranchus ocellatus TaxID=259542 RepID=A0AAV4DS83_9GAST|nr:hypothetical protein PoB_007353400 [Plakobranchus ocellatus]